MAEEQKSHMFYELKKTIRNLEKQIDINRIFISYILILAQRSPNTIDLNTILNNEVISENLKTFFKSKFSSCWYKVVPILRCFTEKELVDYLNNDENEVGSKAFNTSSKGLVDLINKVLDIRQGDEICDLGSGSGDYLNLTSKSLNLDNSENKVVGYEVFDSIAAISEIKLSLNCVSANVVWSDYFNLEFKNHKYDKVFMCPPFGRLQNLTSEISDFIKEVLPDFPINNSSNIFYDWYNVARAVGAMKEGGKAVVILQESAMSAINQKSFRRYFLQRGLIEAIIELPSKLYNFTAVTTYLVLMSEGNEKVKLINASEICDSGRKYNIIKREHTLEILEMLSSESPDKYENRIDVKNDILLSSNSILSAREYLVNPKEMQDGIALKDLIKSIKRGAAISSTELDSLICKSNSSINYITSANIIDGFIDENIMYLSEIPEKFANCQATEGDIIISRTIPKTSSFKVVVVECRDKKVVPNENLYILNIDREKADPFFIKAYFESAEGQKKLYNLSNGNIVKMLPARNLEMLQIPKINIEIQYKIGEKCKDAVHNVIEALKNLEDHRRKLSCVYKENTGDGMKYNR